MEQKTRTITPRFIVMFIIAVVLLPFLPLLITRRWDWWEAWAYAAVYILGFMLSRGLAARRHPDIVRERAESLDHTDTKSWDKKMAPLTGFGGILLLGIAGVDVLFGWTTPFPLGVKIAALALLVIGYAWGAYALIENRFFSGVVRIQRERGHTVVSSGPYALMRHPGYAGAIVNYLATPFLLDSWWALIPALLLVVLLVVRTSLEDRTLQEELEGYRAYAGRVRYRLFPGVW